MDNTPYCLRVRNIFDMFNFRDEYTIDWIMDDIRDDLIDGKYEDKYYLDDDGDLWCNVEGADDLAYRLNIDFNEYRRPLRFMNSINFLTEDKIPLNVDIHLDHENSFPIKDSIINKYISGECIGISLNGKRLEEIDIDLLSIKDRNTLNGSIDKYNEKASRGFEQCERLKSVYKYVEDNDPDICKRMTYLLDYDWHEYDDFSERYLSLFIDCPNITSAYAETYKKLKKRRKKDKRNKKNK